MRATNGGEDWHPVRSGVHDEPVALTDPSYRRCYHVSIEPPCGVMGTQTEVLAASQAEADEKVTRMILTWLRHWAGQDGTGYAWSISNGSRTVSSGVVAESAQRSR